MKVKGQKLKICAKKARAANKRRVAFFPKIATRRIYFIHIFRQLLVPNLSKSEKKSSVLALVPYYTDYREVNDPLAHRFHTKKISSEDSYFCNRAFPGWNAFFGKN